MKPAGHALPWGPILVALGCALLFSYLVTFDYWPFTTASLLVIAGALLLALIALAVAFVLAGSQHRAAMWLSFRNTVVRDWQALIRFLFGRS